MCCRNFGGGMRGLIFIISLFSLLLRAEIPAFEALVHPGQDGKTHSAISKHFKGVDPDNGCTLIEDDIDSLEDTPPADPKPIRPLLLPVATFAVSAETPRRICKQQEMAAKRYASASLARPQSPIYLSLRVLRI